MIEKSNNQHNSGSSGELHSRLSYFKQKVDQLSEERMRWLSKFDECKSLLNNKHQQQDKLRNSKNKQIDVQRSIVHQSIALLDETINTIKAERDNITQLFRDAQQRLKIQQLAEEYPMQIERKVPCSAVSGGLTKNVIHNDLNIHQRPKNKTDKPHKRQSTKKGDSPAKLNLNQLSVRKQRRVNSPEDLLQQQIIQIRNLNDLQLSTLSEQIDNLDKQINDVKENQSSKVSEERKVIDKINKKVKQIEKKHKDLAEEYFDARRKVKERFHDIQRENQTLLQTHETLETKINKELRIYQKQNKAKQALILKKSEDFQQDYKAKMRAKQRNLQALKQNYEKMQNIFIEKARKLEATVDKAKMLLQDAESRRAYLVQELRDQLHNLQKKANEQRIERVQQETKIKQKAEREHARKEEELVLLAKRQKSQQKNRQIHDAYQKTKSPKKPNIKSKRQIQQPIQETDPSDEESMNVSDIENIRKQIGVLEKKICGGEKTR